MNNKGADQPALPHSLVSTFVICFLKSTISKLATSAISNLELVPVAEQAGLNLILSETLKTGFVAMRPICVSSSNATVGQISPENQIIKLFLPKSFL